DIKRSRSHVSTLEGIGNDIELGFTLAGRRMRASAITCRTRRILRPQGKPDSIVPVPPDVGSYPGFAQTCPHAQNVDKFFAGSEAASGQVRHRPGYTASRRPEVHHGHGPVHR